MLALDNEVYRLMRHNAAMARLVTVVQELSHARTLPGIINIVRHAARELTAADGATFVLRDGDKCYYADEDAITPLWKGKRFPLQGCVTGWAMLNAKPVLIEDVFDDPRVPADLYRPTFVKSMAVVPIRPSSAIGAIGAYWAVKRLPTADELMLLEALANTASVAMENAQLAAEQRAQLEAMKSAQEDARLALEAAQMGRWDYDLVTQRYFWDSRSRQIFGLPEGEDIQRDRFWDCVVPADRERVMAAMASAMNSPDNSGIAMQFQIIRADDGAPRWVYTTGRTYFDGPRCVRCLGVIEDVTDQKRLEQHLRLLVNELNHRVKNSLAVVQAIATQTFRSTSSHPAAIEAFSARIAALAKTHDVLTEDNWSGTDLRDIAGLIGKTLATDSAARLRFSGPNVRLAPKTAVSLSLALHELATNAAKYGALSNEFGNVLLYWQVEGLHEDRRLFLHWEEQGGPEVVKPVRQGFGLRVLQRILPADLNGEVNLSYLPSGVVCTIEAPLETIPENNP